MHELKQLIEMFGAAIGGKAGGKRVTITFTVARLRNILECLAELEKLNATHAELERYISRLEAGEKGR